VNVHLAVKVVVNAVKAAVSVANEANVASDATKMAIAPMHLQTMQTHWHLHKA
jgi:hypothetical protein